MSVEPFHLYYCFLKGYPIYYNNSVLCTPPIIQRAICEPAALAIFKSPLDTHNLKLYSHCLGRNLHCHRIHSDLQNIEV